MEFQLVTPQATVYSSDKANLVGGRTKEGSFSILPRHIPALMELEPAVLKVKADDEVVKFLVQGGFLFKERDETIKILTPEAKRLDEIDEKETRERLEELTRELEGLDEEAPSYNYLQTKLNRAQEELDVVENEG